MGLSSERRPIVTVVGPVSPPANGMTMMTEVVLGSSLRDEFRLLHVDTSDHREIAAVGRLDLWNVWLAARHALAFGVALLRRPALCYLPVARNRLGFLRDAALLLLARLARRSCVVHFHGRGFSDFYAAEPRWLRLLIRLALHGRTHAVVLGESRRQEFAGLLPDARVHAVPNGIPDHAHPGVADEPRERLVLHLATLMREKGVFGVIEAAHKTQQALPDATFVLAGDWYREEERNQAQAYLAEHGLEDRVQIAGPVHGAAKAELLARAAAMAFPSRYPYEGHPLVVLEALCSGTPVIATPIGCVPEMICNGREGFLVAEGDADALGARLVELLGDEELRRRMGHAARRRYEEAFTSQRFAERLGEVWRRVLAGDVVAEPLPLATSEEGLTP